MYESDMEHIFWPFWSFASYTNICTFTCSSRKNAIIISSTASGKTEAVVAPLCERILKNKIEAICIYITPTKALANDLFERLNEQMSELNLKILVKTGDKPQINIQNFQIFS